MSLVLISSAILAPGFFSAEHRLEQTLESIASVRKYIPDSIIHLCDITLEETHNYIIELKKVCDQVIVIDPSENKNKSAGESIIIKRLLQVADFTNVKIIYKLSGRYCITEKFNQDNFDREQYNFLLGDNCYNTTLYSLPPHKVNEFIGILETVPSLTDYQDIEHILYRQINPHQVCTLQVLGCSGWYHHGGTFYDR